MKQELSIQQDLTLSEVGKTFAQSGFFADSRDASQAVVKVIAGQEMGFGPVTAMTGIHIIKGNVTIGAHLMAAGIKSHPKYDYRATFTDDDSACTILFFEYLADGLTREELGRETFTLDDAQRAGLSKNDNWKKYPRNMLFARAMSNGVRFYCPDVFSGALAYTPEELAENGGIVDPLPVDIDAVVEDIATEVAEVVAPAVEQAVEEVVDVLDGEVLVDPTPAVEEGPKVEAVYRYLKQCQEHKERVGEVQYYTKLAEFGLKKSNGVERTDFTTMTSVIVGLSVVPDLTSDEGFEKVWAYWVGDFVQADYVGKLNALLKEWELPSSNKFTIADVPVYEDRRRLEEEVAQLYTSLMQVKAA